MDYFHALSQDSLLSEQGNFSDIGRVFEEDYSPHCPFSIMPDHLENINHAASEQGNVLEIGRVSEEGYYPYSSFSIMPDHLENISHAAS